MTTTIDKELPTFREFIHIKDSVTVVCGDEEVVMLGQRDAAPRECIGRQLLCCVREGHPRTPKGREILV